MHKAFVVIAVWTFEDAFSSLFSPSHGTQYIVTRYIYRYCSTQRSDISCTHIVNPIKSGNMTHRIWCYPLNNTKNSITFGRLTDVCSACMRVFLCIWHRSADRLFVGFLSECRINQGTNNIESCYIKKSRKANATTGCILRSTESGSYVFNSLSYTCSRYALDGTSSSRAI